MTPNFRDLQEEATYPQENTTDPAAQFDLARALQKDAIRAALAFPQ